MKNHFEVSVETKIDVNVKELFAFHTNTHNLPLITPKNIHVEIVSVPEILVEKSVVVLNITKWGFTQQWQVELNQIVKPTLIKDVALKSPLKSFVHDHIFKEVTPMSSLLCDKIIFSLPFAPFSNFIAPLVKKDIENMFIYRHKATKKILESII